MVHPSAATGFAAAADDYEAARPGYPPGAVYWLVEQLGLEEDTTLVDLAAGTGKLTRLLAPLVGRTIAVEPVAAMRAKLHEVLPQAEVVDGAAESMPLPGATADAVTVAQAFHWFDVPRAAAEIRRVLRPGGRLAIVWNVRDLDDPVQSRMEEIVGPHREGTPFHRGSPWREEIARGGVLRIVAEARMPFTHELSRAGLVTRVASTSFIAALPDRERRAALQATEELAAGLEEPIGLRHVTELYCLAPA